MPLVEAVLAKHAAIYLNIWNDRADIRLRTQNIASFGRSLEKWPIQGNITMLHIILSPNGWTYLYKSWRNSNSAR